ncbi:tyrosine-type recombinase/integrase [Paraburkholderia sediminicola]|uniref:tyrosine-type recombinase/integrase n=1 Tax=Paraburkholderia sediminicola TaxID=458836 RepID=UPI0038B9CB40
MQESFRDGTRVHNPIFCDLSELTSGYDERFLLALKEQLISSRHRLALRTIKTNYLHLRLILTHVYTKGFRKNIRILRIDVAFVTALHTIAEEFPSSYLSSLKGLFRRHQKDERLFANDLQIGDFPVKSSKRGRHGDQIHSVLAKALRRSTLVHILDVVENAFEEDRLDLARYALIKLALNIFCRPASYAQLTLSDLRIDKCPETGAMNYFLAVAPVKSKVHQPEKIIFRIHPEVGKLLAMQRHAVVKKYGMLAPMSMNGRDHGQLALFPSRRLNGDGSSWHSNYAKSNNGMLQPWTFGAGYLKSIQKLVNTKLTFTAFRHTIGTQLALMGCSAHTIQAALKHSSPTTCNIYVDLAFQGLIDNLSDSLRPSFDRHFPIVNSVASIADAHPPERRIDSADLESGRVETTGICGRQVACSYAPIACYACPRFIPCIDADHTINLKVVDREIALSENRGLAMQHDVKRWKTIRNHILLVVSISETKRSNNTIDAAENIEESA